MINVDDWAEIRRLYFAERLGIKTIARQLGVARNTVRTAVRGSAPPDYKREAKGSLVDAVENQICELLRDCPTMPATVIAERIEWPHGITILRDRVAELRPLFRPPDPVPAHPLRARRGGPVRPVAARLRDPPRLRPDRQALGGHRGQRLLPVHGRPPGPHPGRARRAGRDAVLPRSRSAASPALRCGTARAASASGVGASRSTPRSSSASGGPSAMGARLCKPNDPEAKGMNERANGYYETSFLPGGGSPTWRTSTPSCTPG